MDCGSGRRRSLVDHNNIQYCYHRPCADTLGVGENGLNEERSNLLIFHNFSRAHKIQ